MTTDLNVKCASCTTLCTEKIEFLAGLPSEKHVMIAQCAIRHRLSKGSFLFLEGDGVDAIYIIHSGKVKLSTSDKEGKEHISGIFSEKDTIWDGIFVQNSRYPYSGICITDVDCCKIYRRDFEKVILDPMISMRIIGLLSKKLHEANEKNLLLSTTDPKARIAGFLLYRSKRSATDTVTLRLEDIAASINLRPETISRKLKELEAQGLIRKTGQSSVLLKDTEGLKNIFQE